MTHPLQHTPGGVTGGCWISGHKPDRCLLSHSCRGQKFTLWFPRPDQGFDRLLCLLSSGKPVPCLSLCAVAILGQVALFSPCSCLVHLPLIGALTIAFRAHLSNPGQSPISRPAHLWPYTSIHRFQGPEPDSSGGLMQLTVMTPWTRPCQQSFCTVLLFSHTDSAGPVIMCPEGLPLWVCQRTPCLPGAVSPLVVTHRPIVPPFILLHFIA